VVYYEVIGDHLTDIEDHIHHIDERMNSDYTTYYIVIFGTNLFLYLCLFFLLAYQVNVRIVVPIRALTEEIVNPDRAKRVSNQKVTWSSSAV